MSKLEMADVQSRQQLLDNHSQSYVQHVPVEIQKFIYLEFSRGKPSLQAINSYRSKPSVRYKVNNLYKKAKARKIKLQQMRKQPKNLIEELPSS